MKNTKMMLRISLGIFAMLLFTNSIFAAPVLAQNGVGCEPGGYSGGGRSIPGRSRHAKSQQRPGFSKRPSRNKLGRRAGPICVAEQPAAEFL